LVLWWVTLHGGTVLAAIFTSCSRFGNSVQSGRAAMGVGMDSATLLGGSQPG
jgi:hypothetical protein